MILVAASTREVTEVVYNADAVEFFFSNVLPPYILK